jgi:hypothetical protein
MYPTEGDNMAIVQGRLTIETDVTNREKEAVPAGTMIKAYNYSLVTDVAFTGTTDADGNYSISVPVQSYGNNDITLVFPEIYTNQTVAIQDEETGVIEVVERPTLFALDRSSENNAIPSVPSVYVTVEEPASATIGSGFSLGVKTVPSPLSFYSWAYIIDGGSGYPDGNDQLLTLSNGSNGLAANIQVDIVNGSIVNFDFFDNNGAVYTTTPTFNPNQLGGSGAEILIAFQTNHKIYITNNGSGYTSFPDFSIQYKDYSGSTLLDYTFDYNLDSYTNLVNGKIVNDNAFDVDTIISSFIVAEAPVPTIVNLPTRPMMVKIEDYNVNATTGAITGMNVIDGGLGYDIDDAPEITFTSILDYGVDADINVYLNTSGTYSGYTIVNAGSGYLQNVNDFQDDGSTDDEEEDPSFSNGTSFNSFRYVYDVVPGEVTIRSAHYGTGTPDDDLE